MWPGATDHPQARAWESSVHMSVTSWVRGGWEKGHRPYVTGSFSWWRVAETVSRPAREPRGEAPTRVEFPAEYEGEGPAGPGEVGRVYWGLPFPSAPSTSCLADTVQGPDIFSRKENT